MVQQPKTLTFQNSRHPRQKATTATRISSRVSESLRLSRAELNFTPATPAARFIWEKNVRFPEKTIAWGKKKTFIMGGNRGFFPTWKFLFCSFRRSVKVQLTTIWMAGEWSNLILWLVGQLLPNGSWLIMRDPRESQRQHQSHHLGLLQLWHKSCRSRQMWSNTWLVKKTSLTFLRKYRVTQTAGFGNSSFLAFEF